MRVFAYLTILIFIFGFADFPVLAEVSASHASSCCCSSSVVCHCHHAEGSTCLMKKHRNMNSESGVVFKEFGCGMNPGHKTLPTFAKDFYLGVFIENYFYSRPDILLNPEVSDFVSLPVSLLEIPPKFFFRIS